MGETRVDLLHLLEDLADAYPGDLDETILTEIVANSLDSGASRIAISIDPLASTFTVVDDGKGMRRSDLRRFHDIAATSKTRGEGIGFAGVGIKLGLLVSDAVITETRRGKDHLATTWALAGRQRAPWRWIPPTGLVGEQGTAVQLRLTTALSRVRRRYRVCRAIATARAAARRTRHGAGSSGPVAALSTLIDTRRASCRRPTANADGPPCRRR